MVPLIPSTLQGSIVKMTSNILEVSSVRLEQKDKLSEDIIVQHSKASLINTANWSTWAIYLMTMKQNYFTYGKTSIPRNNQAYQYLR